MNNKTNADMVDSSIEQCRQRLGFLHQISKYLGTERLVLAFVHPVEEYGNMLMMGASATWSSKLDCIQYLAERLCSTWSHHHAAVIGSSCKLFDGIYYEYLQCIFLFYCSTFEHSMTIFVGKLYCYYLPP